MRQVALLFSDSKITQFMQHADLFERFKVILKPIVYATVVDDWGQKHIDAIKSKFGEDYKLVAAVGEKSVIYVDPEVKVVSDGQKWCLLEDYLKTVKVQCCT